MNIHNHPLRNGALPLGIGGLVAILLWFGTIMLDSGPAVIAGYAFLVIATILWLLALLIIVRLVWRSVA